MTRFHTILTTGFVAVTQNPFEGHAFLCPTWRRHRLPRFCNQDVTPISKPNASSRLFSVISENQDFASTANDDDRSSSSSAREKSKDASVVPNLYTYQKPRQIRRIPTKRKPRNYWHSTSNLRNELTSFWKEYGVPLHTINPGRPPPIPSEYLLNFFQRNDLRGAIAQNGGRENVSHLLGGAKIIPGKWKEAVEMEEVKYLLPFMTSLLKNEPLRDSVEELQFEGHISGTRVKRNSTDNGTVSDATNSLKRVETPTGDRRLVDLVRESSPHEYHSDASLESTKEFWSKEKTIAAL
ncbi:hypothetical protein ACHAWX_002581 [Stephanocyclus meneghinianus]